MVDEDYISIIRKNNFENNPQRFIFVNDSYDLTYNLIKKYKDILIDDYYCAMQSFELDPIIASIILNIDLDKHMFLDNDSIDRYIDNLNKDPNIYYEIDKNFDIMNDIFNVWFDNYIFTVDLILPYLSNYYSDIKDIAIYITNDNLIKIKSIISTYIFTDCSYDKLINYKNIMRKYYYKCDELSNNGKKIIKDVKQLHSMPKYIEIVYVSSNKNVVNGFYDTSSSILLYINFISATINNDKKLLFAKPLITLDHYHNQTIPLNSNYNFIIKILDRNHSLTFQDIMDNYNNNVLLYNCEYKNILKFFIDYYNKNSRSLVAVGKCDLVKNNSYICNNNSIKGQVFLILLDKICYFIKSNFRDIVLDKFFEDYPQYENAINVHIDNIYSSYPVFCNDDGIITSLQTQILDNDNNLIFYLNARVLFNEVAFTTKTHGHLIEMLPQVYNIVVKSNLNDPTSKTKVVNIDNFASIYTSINRNSCYDIILKIFEKYFVEFMVNSKENLYGIIDEVDSIISKEVVSDKPRVYYNGNIDDFFIELNYYFNKDIYVKDFIVRR